MVGGTDYDSVGPTGLQHLRAKFQDANDGLPRAPGTHTIYDSLGRVVGTERLASLRITLSDDPSQSDPALKITPEPDPIDVGTTLTSDETFYGAAGRVDYTRQDDGTHVLVSKNVYDAAGRLTQSTTTIRPRFCRSEIRPWAA